MDQATALWIRQQLYGTGNSFKEQATLGQFRTSMGNLWDNRGAAF